MIETKKLTKIYHTGEISFKALENVNIKISKGEFVAIMGPSGAGKSTLMYQISLLDTPSEGTIKINKKNPAKFTNSQRTKYRLNEFGFIFQDYALLPDLTAQENIMLPLLMKGLSKKEALNKSEITLKQVDLEGKNNNLPSQLSGGEQQRVSVARAIVNQPKILFADEPTANLDSSNGHNILKLLSKLHKKGQTIIMVTHEKEYSDYAQRIIKMKDGKIIK